MDEELLELQRQFEFAQEAKSSIRLTDRNVVELVQKLQKLDIIDFDLLHTTSGKEYITPEHLRKEILGEIKKRGRVSLIDLSDIVVVDLYHVEKQSQLVVSNDCSLMLVNGELIWDGYWDTVAEEINERLQECSQISLAEIAAQLQVGSDLVVSFLEPRLGTLVKGRLEGGQLYTPAYVARVTSMVRGAARGVAVPTSLSGLWSTLQILLQDFEGFNGVAVDSSFFQSIFNNLVKGGEILGSLRAGVNWTPSVFAMAQKECIDALFSQHSFVSYEALQRVGIQQQIQFLQARYPDGVPLVTVFAHGSLIEMLNAAVEDAIERGSWIDSLSVLPASFVSEDAAQLLSRCPSVQRALKSSKALVLEGAYFFSESLLTELFTRIERDTEIQNASGLATAGFLEESHPIKYSKQGSGARKGLVDPENSDSQSATWKPMPEKVSKKKKGISSKNVNVVDDETVPAFQESTATQNKKKFKKGKVTTPASNAIDSKSGSKKDSNRVDSPIIMSEESLIPKIIAFIPDLEEKGMYDAGTVLASLASYLKPKLLSSWIERRKAASAENSQKMKQVLENLQKKLDEAFLNIQLYEKALELFEDDLSTSVLLHKHLLRTSGVPMVDTILANLDMHKKLSNGDQVEEIDATSLSSNARITLAKNLPVTLSVKSIELIETLGEKRVEPFMNAIRELAEEIGLTLKKLDKKSEKTLLYSYRKDLTSQVSIEIDPVSLLPKVVSLLYVQIHGKALQAPGRAISVAVSKLEDKIDASLFKILSDYHKSVVTLLALVSAGTDNDESCSSDRIQSKRELLEGLIPALKSMVLGSS